MGEEVPLMGSVRITPTQSEKRMKSGHLLHPQALERESWHATRGPHGELLGSELSQAGGRAGRAPLLASGGVSKQGELLVCLTPLGPSWGRREGELGQGLHSDASAHLVGCT